MGQIYYRQEKYDLALCHFRSAAAVNPRSSVLRCYTGMALAKQGMNDKALARLQVGARWEGGRVVAGGATCQRREHHEQ